MSGSDNPYNGSFGNQMTATTSFGAQPATAAAAGGYITDTTTANFGKDVIEESRNQPVLVDFWAPWCGPCKQLTPVLEKVVNEAKGRVRLVKMNIDDHPSIAGQLGIQSIPAVIAFVNGRPADGFMGAVPESQIQQFIDRIAGPAGADEAAEIEAVLTEAAELLAAGNINEAAQLYAAVMQADPENAKAVAGMAECMIAANQHERARQTLTDLPEELAKDPGIQAVLKKLEQIEEARKLGDPVALERDLAVNPDDHEARLELAKALAGAGRLQEASDHLLTIIARDRAWNDDAARKQLLTVFEAAGPTSEVAKQGRRRLSSILFS